MYRCSLGVWTSGHLNLIEAAPEDPSVNPLPTRAEGHKAGTSIHVLDIEGCREQPQGGGVAAKFLACKTPPR